LYCLTNLSGTDWHLPEGCQAGKPDMTQAVPAIPPNAFWPTGQASIKTAYNQTLSCVPSSTGILRERWAGANVEIRFRRGGEKICLPGRQGHHSLKNLFQEAGIPPWERDRVPLIYLDDRLAAVGDKWISAAFYHEETPGCVSLLLQS
jgi:tRNA(Ile)-lysidine synthase